MPEQITFNRFTASYQLFGDVPDGKKWLEEILEEVKKDWPAVLRFEVLACVRTTPCATSVVAS